MNKVIYLVLISFLTVMAHAQDSSFVQSNYTEKNSSVALALISMQAELYYDKCMRAVSNNDGRALANAAIEAQKDISKILKRNPDISRGIARSVFDKRLSELKGKHLEAFDYIMRNPDYKWGYTFR